MIPWLSACVAYACNGKMWQVLEAENWSGHTMTSEGLEAGNRGKITRNKDKGK